MKHIVVGPSADLVEMYVHSDPGNSDESWKQTVISEFRTLFSAGELLGVALTEAPKRVTALILGGFLAPKFSQEILKFPKPYVKSLAIEWIKQGREVLLPKLDCDSKHVAREAANAGLHLHLFAFGWPGEPMGFESMQYRSILSAKFNEAYQGMNLRLMTVEAHGSAWIAAALRHGFKICNSYPEAKFTSGSEKVALMSIDRDGADNSGNAGLIQLFSACPPRLTLSNTQRRILFHFRSGATDEETAAHVYLSPKSMKTYWDRIYDLFEREVPHIFDSCGKRKSIERYIRLYPEEVWPYECGQ